MTQVTSVKEGKLRGEIYQSVLGCSYVGFKGIPYAAPPIGDLRFKDPEPPLPWTGIRNACDVRVNVCVQIDEYPPYDIIGDEDSLYLNVYTPSLIGSRPVMVYIHGGAFISGSGTDMHIKPDYLISKDIVLVTINYRLGFLGFMSLNDEVANGNQGLKDQVAALKWIQENIINFGGDPNNVTIFGASVGAVCVNYLMYSDMAKGLFHKAICQSGLSDCPWGAPKHELSEYCLKLASHLGCDSKNPKEIIKYLRTLPASKLVKAQHNLLGTVDLLLYKLPFGPSLDPKSKNPCLPRPIITESSNAMNIPMMLGYTNDEYVLFFKNSSDAVLKKLDQILDLCVKRLVTSLKPENFDKLMSDIRQHYFNNRPLTKELIPSLINLMTSIYMVVSINGVADKRRKRTCTPTYLYQYTYIGNEVTITDTLKKQFSPTTNIHYFPKGASHVDELSYLFYITRCKANNPYPPKEGTNDRITLERMTRMWTNFAKTGNPTPKNESDECIDVVWEPVTKDSFTYFQIGKELKNCMVQDTLQDMYEKYV